MKRKKRLAIITTHPIQYNAPLFRLINDSKVCFIIKVFYTWSQSQEKVFDKEFGVDVKWDIPLLAGYDYTFVRNTSSSPGSHHFRGIVNPDLNTEIEAWQADAILVYGWAFSSHLKAIRHFHNKIPVLFRGDSTLLDEVPVFSIKKFVRRVFLQWVYSHIDYGLYVGAANQKYFLTNGLKQSQLLFAPHAIDNKRFAGEENEYIQQAKKWRADLGIKEEEIVFLFAAKLTKKKDPELLIKAFLGLKTKATLLIVGNGELENKLKETYKSYPGIVFIDFQNQSVMPVVYRLAEVFVLPSQGPGETWGLAVNEAMACARAVIVSEKCGCCQDLVLDGKNGYVFESGNAENLQNCMKLLSGNYKAAGLYSREIIGSWNYEKTADQLNMLFEKTIV